MLCQESGTVLLRGLILVVRDQNQILWPPLEVTFFAQMLRSLSKGNFGSIFYIAIISSFFIDGDTTGPESWSGPIGKAIGGKNGLLRTPMNPKFKPISGLVAPIDKALLQNNDITNLFHLCLLIQAGPKAKHLVKHFDCSPGNVSQARWITTANNILILYMQSMNPSNELRLIVRIVVNLYAPSIFRIKKDFHVANGPKHFFHIFTLAKDLFKAKQYDKYLEVVKTTLQTNGFHCHPENLLITMSLDKDVNVKKKAIEVIKKRREVGETDEIKSRRLVQYAKEEKYKKDCPLTSVRKFKVPELNWSASAYHELVDWDELDEIDFSSPAIFSKYSLEEIEKNQFDEDFFRIPCHSQAVERAVYLTSQAAETVIGYENRHGFILNKLQSAEKIPTNFNRKHFKKIQNYHESPF